MQKIGQLNFPNSAFFGESLTKKIAASASILKIAYADYGPEIGVCFNGGKDSTVVLDLVKRFHDAAKITTPVKPFFIDTDNNFPEIKDYLHLTEKHWGVKIRKVHSKTIKSGLEKVIEEHGITSYFLGQRFADPECKAMSEFTPTTKNWAKAMRILPIIQWSYHDVWKYIDTLHIPHCPLYSKGYTSIGSIIDTKPNPLLLDPKTNTYKHARLLENETAERLGRTQIQ